MNSSIPKKTQNFDVTIFNFIVDSIFIVDQNVKYDNKFKINEFIAKSIIQTRTKLIVLIKLLLTFKQFLHVIISKRKKKLHQMKKNETNIMTKSRESY